MAWSCSQGTALGRDAHSAGATPLPCLAGPAAGGDFHAGEVVCQGSDGWNLPLYMCSHKLALHRSSFIAVSLMFHKIHSANIVGLQHIHRDLQTSQLCNFRIFHEAQRKLTPQSSRLLPPGARGVLCPLAPHPWAALGFPSRLRALGMVFSVVGPYCGALRRWPLWGSVVVLWVAAAHCVPLSVCW